MFYLTLNLLTNKQKNFQKIKYFSFFNSNKKKFHSLTFQKNFSKNYKNDNHNIIFFKKKNFLWFILMGFFSLTTLVKKIFLKKLFIFYSI